MRPSNENISQDLGPIKDDKKGRLLSSIVGNFGLPILKTSGRGVENSFLAITDRVNDPNSSLNNDKTTSSSVRYQRCRLIDVMTGMARSGSSSLYEIIDDKNFKSSRGEKTAMRDRRKYLA